MIITFPFDPSKQFNSFKELEYKGLEPAAIEDTEAIQAAFDEQIPVMLDEMNRVWIAGGIYIADVKYRA